MIRSLAIAIAALFALVSIDAVADETPTESSPPAPSKGSKKRHAKSGAKKGGAKAEAEATTTKPDKYAATLEKVRDMAFNLETLTHIDHQPTDFAQRELVGGIQGEKMKVKKVLAKARKFAATQKFRHLVTILDPEAVHFAERLKVCESLAVANGWITE
jgi:hypothetical protein